MTDPEVTYVVADASEGMATLPDRYADLICTSPPYYQSGGYLASDHPDKPDEIGTEPSHQEFVRTLWEVIAQSRRVLAPHGSLVLEMGDPFVGSSLRLIPEALRFGMVYGTDPWNGLPAACGRWHVRNVVRWHHPGLKGMGPAYHAATSDIVIASQRPDRFYDPRSYQDHHGGDFPEDMWSIPLDDDGGWAAWPAQVPRIAIETLCPARVCQICGLPDRDGLVGWSECLCDAPDKWRRGRVLDPFGGTGPTARAALELGRDSVMIDLDGRNLGICAQRLGVKPKVVRLRQPQPITMG